MRQARHGLDARCRRRESSPQALQERCGDLRHRDRGRELGTVELTPRLVLEKVLRPVESRGAIETAHRIRGVISQVMRYGVACGLCDRDITADLRGALKPVQRKHHAALDADGTTDSAKVGGLLRAIDGFDGSFIVKCALRFHPYVATRPGELRHAEWSEIDGDLEARLT